MLLLLHDDRGRARVVRGGGGGVKRERMGERVGREGGSLSFKSCCFCCLMCVCEREGVIGDDDRLC